MCLFSLNRLSWWPLVVSGLISSISYGFWDKLIFPKVEVFIFHLILLHFFFFFLQNTHNVLNSIMSQQRKLSILFQKRVPNLMITCLCFFFILHSVAIPVSSTNWLSEELAECITLTYFFVYFYLWVKINWKGPKSDNHTNLTAILFIQF
jgi:hypothetical protein